MSINLYSFLPLLYHSQVRLEKEDVIIYFGVFSVFAPVSFQRFLQVFFGHLQILRDLVAVLTAGQVRIQKTGEPDPVVATPQAGVEFLFFEKIEFPIFTISQTGLKIYHLVGG